MTTKLAIIATAISTAAASAQGLELTPLSTVRPAGPAADLFDASAAEIVKFDPQSKRMFIVNGKDDAIDIYDASNPAAPVFVTSVDLSAIGNPNSVSVNPRQGSNEVAVALAAPSKADRGQVVFMDTSGNILQSVQVGYLPDMLTYDATGRMVVVANEGEPTEDYSFDPEGSVSIIRIAGRKRSHTEVTLGGLTAQDVQGVRITGPAGTTIAQDLEPEFVAIEGSTAFVTCQENNAVLKIDLNRARVAGVLPLGTIDHSRLGSALDVSDRDNMIRIANWPVHGMFMPDGIATYTTGPGKSRMTYFVTANEGDARDWGDYLDESRVRSLRLDPSAFPLGDVLRDNANLGRLAVVNTNGDVDGDGDFDQLFSYGTRSFSIFDQNGNLVFDSGAMIETYIAENYPDDFNCAHDESGSSDSRSDNKGPEPEAIALGTIGGRTYAFVGLERFSGIAVFDITDPASVTMAGFGINRDFSVEFDEDNLDNFAAAGDLGPEGIEFVPAGKSPNGRNLLLVANEVSGSTTIYQILPASAP